MTRLLAKGPVIARVLLGLMFTVFGLNGFLGFLPAPQVPPEAGAFLGALDATGYMFPFIKGTEVIVGLALLFGRYVPLALVVLAPVVLNIIAFHVLLAPAGSAMGLIAAALMIYLAWSYRDAFRPLLTGSARPVTAADQERAPLRTAAARS